jgi:ribonuclease HI
MNSTESANIVTIYIDGACRGNPGPGGYGIILKSENRTKELSGGFRLTTNNRMEIMPAIIALETLKSPCTVVVYSDSQYLVNAVSLGWARRWQVNGWMRNKTDKAVNPDLWQHLLKLCDYHRVEFRWIKGHNSHRENERCDVLSVAAASKPGLPVDHGYENRGPDPAAQRLL